MEYSVMVYEMDISHYIRGKMLLIMLNIHKVDIK